jgi:predicted porin
VADVGRNDTSVDALGFANLTGVLSWGGDVTAHPFDNDNADWDFRVNNSAKYVTPTYRGLTCEAMSALGDNADSFANNRMWGVTLNYHAGEFAAAASYLKMNSPGQTTSGAIATGQLFEASSQQNVGIAVHYRFPKFAVGAAWSHVDVYGPTGNVWIDNSSLANGASWHAWKFDNFEASSLRPL